MSIWKRIAEAISSLAAGEGLSAVFEKFTAPPQRSVAFTIAVIGLGAKMAKADGQVTRDEVSAFREVFFIAPEAEAQAARVFNMARTDVAGFEGYAARIAAMFTPGAAVLDDLLEGLFHIAMADGRYHPAEDEFLRRVAGIFGVDDRRFRALKARHVRDERDPYAVLGLSPDASDAEITARRRELVRESHPDRMMARGVPEEAVKLATARLAAVNAAYEEITALRRAD